MLQYYEFPHRHRRWYLVLFHQLCEMSVHNAWIVYNTIKGTSYDLLQFQRKLIDDVFSKRSGPLESPGGGQLPLVLVPRTWRTQRLTDRHFQDKIENSKPDCCVCSQRPHHRKQTVLCSVSAPNVSARCALENVSADSIRYVIIESSTTIRTAICYDPPIVPRSSCSISSSM